MGDIEKGNTVSDGKQDDSEASLAKIWSVYISEAEKYDKALVESWRGDMDGMLIFAGLFSASLTAFIIESYKTLTPDSGDTTVALLTQISNQLAASASGTTFEVPSPIIFEVPATSIVCNVLWFISLGLSLSCALIATLVEQWARDFIQKADMRPSPVIRARIFSYLYYGLKRFNMHALVDLVPLLLHMSLVLFFAGLVAFLLPINRTVMAVAAALLGIIVDVYCALTLLPLIYFDCPYRTPFSTVLWRISFLCRRIPAVAVLFSGRPQELVRETADQTTVEVMISRATASSAERDQRDLRSLCWTMKSLVDATELEPFIDGIPDALWGPNGRRHKHDHLIRILLDDPDVRLGDRLLDLMRHANSGLLTPDIETRYKISCLKALWSIASLAEKGAPLNLPSARLVHEFHDRQGWPRSSYDISDLSRELQPYLHSTVALLAWNLLCSLDTVLQNLQSELQRCEADVGAGRICSFDAVLTGLHQMLQDYHIKDFLWLTSEQARYRPTYFVNYFTGTGYLDFEGYIQHISASVPSTITESLSWLNAVRFLIDGLENYWDNVRHTILTTLFRTSLSPSDRPQMLYKFDETLKILQHQLSPPSALLRPDYEDVLEQINAPLDDTIIKDPWGRHNAEVLIQVTATFFPVGGSSPPPISLASINTLISFIRRFTCAVPHEVLFSNNNIVQPLWRQLHPTNCHLTYLCAGIFNYLSSGCPHSNTTQTTLEVVCDLYNGLWHRWQVSMHALITDSMPPNYQSLQDPWFDELTLSTIQALLVSPPYYSVLASVKAHILTSLTLVHIKILNRLAKGEIIAFTPEFYQSFAEGFRTLSGPTSASGLAFSVVPVLSPDSQNVVPTQADWDESITLLSHRLLQEDSSSGAVPENHPNFDFEACDDDVQKVVQYVNLLITVESRFCNVNAVLHAEFFEACSSETLPYNALDTLTSLSIHWRVRFQPVLFAHPTHRNRFVNSVQALMKARAITLDHTALWEQFILESSILDRTLDDPDCSSTGPRWNVPTFLPTNRGIAWSDTKLVECRSSMLVIKDTLEEYAASIESASDDHVMPLKVKVKDLLNRLGALLER